MPTKETKKKIGTKARGRKYYPLTEQHKRKISMTLKGRKRRPFPEEWKHKISESHKGKHLSEETRKKMSLAHIGCKHSIETRRKIRLSSLEYFCSPKTREKISGANNHRWKGGITPENERIRNSSEYKEWRLSVFARDNFACQSCGQVGGGLHAHHILGFAKYPEHRFDINNGVTLCIPCHCKVHNRKKMGIMTA